MRSLIHILVIGLAAVATIPGIALAASASPGADDASVVVEDFAFAPEVLTIPIGGAVTWTVGSDPEQHTVTPTDESTFDDSGPLFTGDTFSVRFERAGTFAYLCTFHPFMTGTITVVEAAATATIEAMASAVAAATPAVAPEASEVDQAPTTSPSASPATGVDDAGTPILALAAAAIVAAIILVGAVTVRGRRQGGRRGAPPAG